MEGFHVVDLFAGCGGLSAGFEDEGFIVTGYEIWADACRVYSRNLKGLILHETITATSTIQAHRVLIGGPPCQPFSTTGSQRGQRDARDMVPAVVAAMAAHRPLVAIVENVANLAGPQHAAYLESVFDEMRSLGYTVTHRVLDASAFGVPQKRKRLFIVAHFGGFEFPNALSSSPRTVAQTLPRNSFEGRTADMHPELVLTPAQDIYIAKYEARSSCIRPRDLHPDKPSRTLTCRNLCGATSDMVRVRLNDGRRRQLTMEEAALLQTFPRGYFNSVSRKTAMQMIGNSVPPLLSRAIAAQVALYLVNVTIVSPPKSMRTQEMHPICFQSEDRQRQAAANETTQETEKI